MPHPSLYDAVLDAGDRLVSALTVGDLGGAARALGERRQILDEITAAALPPPPPALVERYRDQDGRLHEVLQGQHTSLSDALSTTGRASVALDRYADATRPPVVDTAPR